MAGQLSKPNQIILWDARHLPLPDSCADLVLTDPPYAPRFLPLWSSVITEAARVLREGGFLAVLTGILGLDALFRATDQVGLRYYALYVQYLSGANTGIVWRRAGQQRMPVVARCKYVTVFVKGQAVANTVTTNFLVAKRSAKRWHEWEQDTDSFRYFIEAFSPPDGLVVDPLAGSGTTAVAAAVVGRRWVVGDIDVRAVVTMRQRLMRRIEAGLMTPLPLLSTVEV